MDSFVSKKNLFLVVLRVGKSPNIIAKALILAHKFYSLKKLSA